MTVAYVLLVVCGVLYTIGIVITATRTVRSAKKHFPGNKEMLIYALLIALFWPSSAWEVKDDKY